jgi:hypothetical protein
LYFYRQKATSLNKIPYLCSRNETGFDNDKDTNGTLRRVPDGFAKLAEPL